MKCGFCGQLKRQGQPSWISEGQLQLVPSTVSLYANNTGRRGGAERRAEARSVLAAPPRNGERRVNTSSCLLETLSQLVPSGVQETSE